MPPSKPKPSEIAAEAKKTYIPYIRQNFQSQWPTQSFLCYSESLEAPPAVVPKHVRFGKDPFPLSKELIVNLSAFYDRDPVDVALDWAPDSEVPIPVIMPANDKRPGGDWEAGTY